MYIVRTIWNYDVHVLSSLKTKIYNIRQSCPPNHKIVDLGLISRDFGLELVVYLQET